MTRSQTFALCLLSICFHLAPAAEQPPVVAVDGQPLGANVKRLVDALTMLGAPLPAATRTALTDAARRRDGEQIQKALDPHALFVVSLNPEVRVKVARGPAAPLLQQGGYTPHIVKIINDSTVTRRLRINSPQSGAVYSGAALSILQRQAQTELLDNPNTANSNDRFLDVEVFGSPPMTGTLSGLKVEYAVVLIYSSEAGRREATIGFDVGAGSQDLGFRGEVPVLFRIRPAQNVRLGVRDFDNKPTFARLTFRDRQGRVYPPQPKRLAPDFFFQPHVYRRDGESVWLPPGKFTVTYNRGPEYVTQQREFTVPRDGNVKLDMRLQRWVNPREHGFYSGDHHIHGAGCSHYENPTKGVTPQDMFRQVKGEGLNVGCVLTWGPCFEFQRQFFSPQSDKISEPFTLLKYDLEISGFGSAALGHVCLLNLNNQTYPESAGTKEQGWPTWTVPVMRWAKEQGGVTGYPHSAMHVDPASAAQQLLATFDADNDRQLSRAEVGSGLLPERFDAIDTDANGRLTQRELAQSANRAADQLPNLAVPSMSGAGAMEIFVSTAEGVCDFISAMDTARIPEWNTWYHILNCGFPLKLSGETDFPCMSSRRVGQGRVYVQLGDVEALDFTQWCRGLAAGRSYVSDGFAHALDFRVAGQAPGGDAIRLDTSGKVRVSAELAFAAKVPRAVAYGLQDPAAGPRMVGDTINLHAPRNRDTVTGGNRLVEVVVNGVVVERRQVPADGKPHRWEIEIPIERSSWVALRQFPQLHTNPVNVIIDDKPIRASRESALWCADAIRLLWKNRNQRIAASERPAAYASYQKAIAKYEQIATESPSNRLDDGK